MDFRHADKAPTAALNAILWREAKPGQPLPAQLAHPVRHGSRKHDND